ncbi:MAG TPA: FAD-dependent oxidoreductase [Syntrophorhabdales bacterium]|nr:FAD-dependent oxidoreductase [Syntrophorhabdales bacterium]
MQVRLVPAASSNLKTRTQEGHMNRRDFLKSSIAGAAAAVGISAGRAEAASSSGVPKKWDYSADVVIVGYGGAGATAAITAFDKGAKVVIIEKAPEGMEGGNTAVNAGIFRCPTDVKEHITYLKALNGAHHVPDDIVRAMAEGAAKVADWIKSFGFGVTPTILNPRCSGAEFPNLPGAEVDKGFNMTRPDGTLGWGKDFWALLIKPQVEEKRKIKILYETPGRELILNERREVIGVLADKGGRPITIKARRAVILAAGGFENSEEMQRDYLVPGAGMAGTVPLKTVGTPYNTGDGIKMAMGAGADLWHMQDMAGPMLHYWPPTTKTSSQVFFQGNSYIITDRRGNRWFDEKELWLHGKGGEKLFNYDAAKTEYARIPSYAIFDETVLKAGPLGPTRTSQWTWVSLKEKLAWSQDNSEEVARGWILKADSTRDLAAKLNVDGSILEATLASWSNACAAGKDALFGRNPATLKPIQGPPYYAMTLMPQVINTLGGPRKNAKTQVLRPNGRPLGRLYAAGEAGSMFGFLYQCGSNFGIDCLVFGKIAGMNAAAEKPWDRSA